MSKCKKNKSAGNAALRLIKYLSVLIDVQKLFFWNLKVVIYL